MTTKILDQPRIIATHGTVHLLANQVESLADLAARRHAHTTACGRKVEGLTGHHVAGEFRIECGNCRRTELYRVLGGTVQ